MPGKFIKRTEGNILELEGEDIELYRKTTCKLIYLRIGRRHLKYVEKESAHGVVEISEAISGSAKACRHGCLAQVGEVGLLRCSSTVAGRAARTP